MLTLVLVVILAALIFEFINGFHDTANSIATVVSTKVLAPGWAVALAAVTNLIGALTGTAVAATIATGLIDTNVVAASSQVILCALLGGIVWNLITWWKGLPSSSSHALIGGLCGAALAAAHNNWDALIWSESAGTWVKNKGLLWKVFVPMVTSPIAGFVLGVLVMLLLWAIIAGMARAGGTLRRLARPRWVNAFFGKAQIASAAYMGYAHGHNDAQKTMGIIALTLMGAQQTGALDDLPPWLAFLHPQAGAGSADVALWIVLTCAVVMAAGTASGGWKIIKTLGHKMVKLHPIHGFAAETSSATILTVAAHFGMPVSTTHSISTAIMGVGFAKNPKALKIGVIERIVWAWILTIPAAGAIAYGLLWGLQRVGWA
ncbi:MULTISPECIES: inorganic phosphate transporter [Pseudoxanthomonas]|uniref:Phosphate transporter n=1 Tax=Pseudoxanthomonas winnipegensis TaxID=2480810 RepID=A0A4Q8M015_9GAMM|nr:MULTISPECIES: inorganic phosphate transporter [Pseudoxanthomonas]MDQ1118572.1 PiT family inorganic phosphate transporter [Pseudoxanthomonas winnipegensis]MDR6138224.1 PiT family inorganic phosphate transporter [Pseudoxanthomonas sp. SORGH_AS_0997]RZZ82796.1 inorganic phosphate transporter [Pseudoxanthomonas winnipegensis]RZZ86722.1 inorganic phosphate transporter [Pseudoxanthomonas winnipegensis]TAA08075.1 inorganic phosphate transporter [Pseudoxanthomonas winnipegensis]